LIHRVIQQLKAINICNNGRRNILLATSNQYTFNFESRRDDVMEKFNNIPFNELDSSKGRHPLTGKPQPPKPGNKPDQNPKEDPDKKKKNPYEITF
jgi:hypothetical protein